MCIGTARREQASVERKTEFIWVTHERLDHDPDNPRRLYPKKDLQKLAESILAGGGVDQALLVTPDGNLPGGKEKFLVVDGNFRLAAVRLLGEKAPLLKCEVIRSLSRRDKLLIMGRTSEHYYPKNPIDRAKLFYQLYAVEGMTQLTIAKELGISNVTISNTLRLLDLDESIQNHIARRRLPSDRRVVDAFMSIENESDRISLADQLAQRRASIKTIMKTCKCWNEHIKESNHNGRADKLLRRGDPPSVAHAVAALDQDSLGESGIDNWGQVRESLKQACAACDLKMENLADIAEPAWEFISHGAEETCGLCSMKGVKAICRGCPLTEFLVRLEQNMRITMDERNSGILGNQSLRLG
jgi:ParB/RepB/Spo0J family partition protein